MPATLFSAPRTAALAAALAFFSASASVASAAAAPSNIDAMTMNAALQPPPSPAVMAVGNGGFDDPGRADNLTPAQQALLAAVTRDSDGAAIAEYPADWYYINRQYTASTVRRDANACPAKTACMARFCPGFEADFDPTEFTCHPLAALFCPNTLCSRRRDADANSLAPRDANSLVDTVGQTLSQLVGGFSSGGSYPAVISGVINQVLSAANSGRTSASAVISSALSIFNTPLIASNVPSEVKNAINTYAPLIGQTIDQLVSSQPLGSLSLTAAQQAQAVAALAPSFANLPLSVLQSFSTSIGRRSTADTTTTPTRRMAGCPAQVACYVSKCGGTDIIDTAGQIFTSIITGNFRVPTCLAGHIFCKDSMC